MSGGVKYGQTLWTSTVDREILHGLGHGALQKYVLFWSFSQMALGRLRYEGGGRSWGVKAFWPRFQFVQTGCEGSSTGPGHTQWKQTKKDKEIMKSFKSNWLWGVIHWTRTHTEETNKERQRKFDFLLLKFWRIDLDYHLRQPEKEQQPGANTALFHTDYTVQYLGPMLIICWTGLSHLFGLAYWIEIWIFIRGWSFQCLINPVDFVEGAREVSLIPVCYKFYHRPLIKFAFLKRECYKL